ncbi:MAG: beta-ketoacyl synthase N-terminal-like domain-containing protein, partial [Myxococcota bacterium]
EASEVSEIITDRNEGIAIFGLGWFFPDDNGVSEFWKNICYGHVAIRDVPPERWDPAMYYSDDRSAPEKTYCRIGGFMAPVKMDARAFRIPPKTLASVDDVQKLALMAVAAALEDAGLEVFSGRGGGRSFNRERTAVIIGNSMGGEWEDLTSLRIWFPVARKALQESEVAKALPEETRRLLLSELEANFKANLPPVTEDSMPGELSNCIAGRIANAFDLRGANFTTDAACAASMAALKAASLMLRSHDVDMAIVGGADKSMDPPTFVKFSKIGALSGKISAPFDARADGFVMGEGVGVMVLKRLSDAERDGDTIYAVVRAVGAASDGKGKGMTAPNPRGQRLAVERAYEDAGLPITSVGLFEAHGTSTVVGDATEVRVLTDLLKEAGAEKKGVPIGSVKSMIGHLKSAAGAASLIKAALALHHKILPPSANFVSPPEDSPLHEGYLNVCTTTRPWKRNGGLRRAAVSAFGFGGTNFHAVLEEYSVDAPEPIVVDPSNHAATTSARATSGASAAPTAAPAATGSADREALTAELTELFAESTGYDIDDLDPSYELESDLGIDTVKQAEILAVIRERYGMPRDDAFRLSDTPTLAAIVDYVASQQTLPQPAQTAAVPTQTQAAPAEQPSHAVAVCESTVLVFGGQDEADVVARAEQAVQSASVFPADLVSGRNDALTAPTRLAFVADGVRMAASKVAEAGRRKAKILAAQGTFLSSSAPLFARGGIAMLFPGQGSQYIGMMRDLAQAYPIVAETFREADEILEPLIGAKLTATVWAEPTSDEEMKAADLALRQTEICQPAMLAADTAMFRLLGQHGIRPSVVAGHSLGEYGACIAAGVLTFADALYAVSARGREMAGVK